MNLQEKINKNTIPAHHLIKKKVGNVLRTSRPSLNTQMISRMSKKLFNNTIQKRKKKLFQCLTIWLLIWSVNCLYNFIQKPLTCLLGEAKHLSDVHYTVVLPCTKRCKTEHYTLLRHEGPKQTKPSANCD